MIDFAVGFPSDASRTQALSEAVPELLLKRQVRLSQVQSLAGAVTVEVLGASQYGAVRWCVRRADGGRPILRSEPDWDWTIRLRLKLD